MQTRFAALLLSLVVALSVGAPTKVNPQVNLAPLPLDPPVTGGFAVAERALAKLITHKRLLVIAAHPDDEDTSLLTLVARDMGGESAYLSLSRGEGGQNLIGRELGVGLGLLRTRELLAARQIDGGRQFFSRAYDFGYTRSLDETLRLWPKEVLLEDAVRVIRRFKPQVVVSIFPGVPHPNHGQHQAAGVTAYAAFPAAGDPNALPQLAAEGLVPWTPQVLYRSAFFSDPKAPAIHLPLGVIDPLAGKSIYQLAAASRSQHRSQDMGRLQELGPEETRVSWVSGGAGADAKELFAGIDTRLSAIAATIPDAERRKRVAADLDAAQAAAESTRRSLRPERLADAVPGFLEALRHLRAAHLFLLDAGDRPEERPAAELIAEKIEVAETGLAAAAGIGLEASTESETLTAGESFPVHAVLWNSGPLAVAGAKVELAGEASAPVMGEARELAAGTLGTWDLKPAVPAEAQPTVPYFLRRPLVGSLYDWTAASPAERGEPFGPPPLTARFSFSVDGVPMMLEREVVHVHRDQALGEIRRPLRVVPRIEVAAAEELLVWPSAQRQPRHLQVTLESHGEAPLRGNLEARIEGDSWPQIRPLSFALEPGEEKTLDVELRPPATLAPGRYAVHLAAVLEDGQRFALGVPLVDYPHIRATPRPVPAEVAISAADVKLPKLTRVGYVRGASDRVPELLRQIGVPLELLQPGDLLEGNLGRYDAVIVGSRAYETDPALVRANHRLLDYAKAGGLVIVQYQQYPYIEGKFAPFPLDIARPHDRVTDETAAVTLLDPKSPVFHVPNEIRPDDWNGWVQERGLYFAHTWDAAYVPLLSMRDPDGEPEQKGSLLVAPLGKGHYVYTGLAFFRQLPAGVPGAYRLFANLLGIGRERPAR
ncbi:MAG TPA: PIG-L family deacetylase [Thermoanaerobaculia bacterium]|nr:PIG-L family deacetylase [Thermoanaerobaculia bacterium]